MKTFIAIIFALCTLTSSVSTAGTDASCTQILKAIKDRLQLFYFNGRFFEKGQTMTPEFKNSFDKFGQQMAEAVFTGCKWLPQTKLNSIASSVFESSPAKCKELSGMFAYQGILRIQNNIGQKDAWNWLYSFVKICVA